MTYDKQRVTIYLPVEVLKKADEVSYRAGLTRNAYVTIAVKRLLEQREITINIEPSASR